MINLKSWMRWHGTEPVAAHPMGYLLDIIVFVFLFFPGVLG